MPPDSLDPPGEWLLKVQEQIVRQMMAVLPGQTVLDVGGGHGQLVNPLIKNRVAGFESWSVFGSSPEASQQIAELVDNRQVAYCSGGSLLSLPFPDRSFDLVISIRIVSHLDDWRAFIKELARVSKHSLIIDYPRKTGIHRLAEPLFVFKKLLEGNTRTYHQFSDQDIQTVLSESGFKVVARHPQFGWPMVVHRKLKNPKLSAALEKIAAAVGLTRFFGGPVLILANRG